MTIKAIVFDLDETLTDRRAAIDLFIQRLITQYFPDSDEVTKLMITERFKEADQNGYRDKREVHQMLVQHLPWMKPPTVDEYLTFFRNEIPQCIKAMDQLISVLDFLRSQGVRLGMITNGTVKVQEEKIRHLGIRSYFHTIVISEEVGMKKPDPEIYRIALQRLHTLPSETWYVGDHPRNDIVGASRSGLQAIWCSRDREPWDDTLEAKPYKTIHKLEELISIYTHHHEQQE
ncbi:HAD family hydrolase [Paenibacillus glucanolyticus]|uniref:HAD family hydrolase n=1 Tax=Paenibacillus glucanolyticus TaxID=59843 RepID=UPI0034D00146